MLTSGSVDRRCPQCGRCGRPPCGGVDRNTLQRARIASVAPHAGAWIETPTGRSRLSPPMRGRGSKQGCRQPRPASNAPVAPHAGAWIETSLGTSRTERSDVAPHAGAWIETARRRSSKAPRASPPMRGRGSKRRVSLRPVAPHAGAWIETLNRSCTDGSPPMRGRGSKPSRSGADLAGRPPCGGVDRNKRRRSVVDETPWSPPMRGRGSKHRSKRLDIAVRGAPSPPMRGRGSKLRSPQADAGATAVAPHAGAWIETTTSAPVSTRTPVAPHAGAWIETRHMDRARNRRRRSPPMRGRGSKQRLGVRRRDRPEVAPHAGVTHSAWWDTIVRRISICCSYGLMLYPRRLTASATLSKISG